MKLFDFFKRKLGKSTEEVNETTTAPENTEPVEPLKPHEILDADVILEAEPKPCLEDMDFSDFWHDAREAGRNHVSPVPDWRVLHSVEEELGYRLPGSYVELMKMHNGGMTNRCWYPVQQPARTYDDYVQITSFLSIGKETPYSLCGRFGSKFLMESYHHDPELGVVIANTVKPGRALVFLDYRECGPQGEPRVTYSDAEKNELTVLAPDFETFLRNLKADAMPDA